MDFLSRIAKGILSKQITYSTPEEPATKKPPELNSQAALYALGMNETGSVKDPYAFSQPSGNAKYGKALGRYQVTEAELKERGKSYLGGDVPSDLFLKYPGLQDTFIQNKMRDLNQKYGWGPEQIAAAHRGGMSKPAEIDRIMSERKGYVDSFMQNYKNYKPITEN